MTFTPAKPPSAHVSLKSCRLEQVREERRRALRRNITVEVIEWIMGGRSVAGFCGEAPEEMRLWK